MEKHQADPARLTDSEKGKAIGSATDSPSSLPGSGGALRALIANLPPLRGWDESEMISDWPAGFCAGETDYRKRVVAYLEASSDE